MPQRIQIGDKWYVAVTSGGGEERRQVLKNGNSFAMFDPHGDIQPGEQGLYHDDTRFLSVQELTIDGSRPLYLGASIKEANNLLIVELMNPDLMSDGRPAVQKGTVHIFRAKLLWASACFEHIRLTNHGRDEADIELALQFGADFVDLFEVRGIRRERPGELQPAVCSADEVVLPYRGRDGLARRTRLSFAPRPARLDSGHAVHRVKLAPGAEQHLYCTIACETGERTPPARLDYDSALRAATASRRADNVACCALETSNPLVNRWLERSASDLAMLTTNLPSGRYPYAGTPWYCTTFGRDGILTAMEALWIDPGLAAGVLSFLAETQATAEDPRNDAEPGKILHEARRSEMANTGEVPFRRYYGSVDATPLFVALAGAYHRWTGDTALIRTLWPHLLAALRWIDRYGDADGDGFVEYARRSEDGLVQQGWKDSQDSVFHADGRLADAPIALCEVQGYVYQAKRAAADLARALGDTTLAERLQGEAQQLRERFDRAFWCDDIGCYAIALDGTKAACRVASSNAGHTLWSGIAGEARADRLAALLTGPAFASGWGVRTIPTDTARYNPMSYHNGSIWPHDNALIAAGLARYGHTAEAVTVLDAIYDASLHFEGHRLPELYCGFPRRAGEGPTLYPVACSPQAWAAAAVFAMLQACLGLDYDAASGRVALQSPRLPAAIDWMRVRQLGAPGRSVDLLLTRYDRSVGVDVLRKDDGIEVVVVV
ncbi:MAG: amylo-alpha-1,6-glucosidase [Proteobacteria bacterium]|nr:amylo-alpha-1,6-glucosidase [Pseudomonadota bacterium]